MIKSLKMLRNIGQFENVSTGANIILAKLTLIYAENGRGKTTLAAIVRSLRDNNPSLILERHRLTSTHPPNIVMSNTSGSDIVFKNGAWSSSLPHVMVFDDQFVAENVYSGLTVDPVQRQNLHELILGSRGLELNQAHLDKVKKIEQHNVSLKAKAGAIPTAVLGNMNVDAFCTLTPRADINEAIQAAERNHAAMLASDDVRQQPMFEHHILPKFELHKITALLQSDLPGLDSQAAAGVQSHTLSLGSGGEGWTAKGVAYAADTNRCPFCDQSIAESKLIEHYRTYFSDAYSSLKTAIVEEIKSLRSGCSGDILVAFERSVKVAIVSREFWGKFTDVPEIITDTAVLVRACTAAFEPLISILYQKQAAPLDSLTISAAVLKLVDIYNILREDVETLSRALIEVNSKIMAVKATSATGNLIALTAEISKLQAIKHRFDPTINALCVDYLQEKTAKKDTENLRDYARMELNEYREKIFPPYQASINKYLGDFLATFRLSQVKPTNIKNGSTCNYSVLVNNVEVPVATNSEGPSFRTALSTGDRHTLALALFFASLDQDTECEQKIVLIDDPMTSLDEHRTAATINQLKLLAGKVEQLIVLSHTKPFLCDLWQKFPPSTSTTMTIARLGNGSTLTNWNVTRDCLTPHDNHHNIVSTYLKASNPDEERYVACALRHILESFMRVSYPAHFPPGALLGRFLQTCDQNLKANSPILHQSDITELRTLLEYANQFHHDSNALWRTTSINDIELLSFSQRTLDFTRRSALN